MNRPLPEAAAPRPPGAAVPAARQGRFRGGRWIRQIARVVCVIGVTAATVAHADAIDTLRTFVRDVRSGSAQFTQTVTSPDGKRSKVSSGSFEFERPDRFRFQYRKPYEQLIVSDGSKVWIHDVDLNQVTVRKLGAALGATPAALLAGASLDKTFELQDEPSSGGLEWVRATPRQKEGAFQSMRIGFHDGQLAAVDILDAFGQRSLLQFSQVVANPALDARTFTFVPPAGADVIEQ